MIQILDSKFTLHNFNTKSKHIQLGSVVEIVKELKRGDATFSSYSVNGLRLSDGLKPYGIAVNVKKHSEYSSNYDVLVLRNGNVDLDNNTFEFVVKSQRHDVYISESGMLTNKVNRFQRPAGHITNFIISDRPDYINVRFDLRHPFRRFLCMLGL